MELTFLLRTFKLSPQELERGSHTKKRGLQGKEMACKSPEFGRMWSSVSVVKDQCDQIVENERKDVPNVARKVNRG